MQMLSCLCAYLITISLPSTASLQVCSLSVGLVGDLCRALGPAIAPYCEEFMMLLLENVAVCVYLSQEPHMHIWCENSIMKPSRLTVA